MPARVGTAANFASRQRKDSDARVAALTSRFASPPDGGRRNVHRASSTAAARLTKSNERTTASSESTMLGLGSTSLRSRRDHRGEDSRAPVAASLPGFRNAPVLAGRRRQKPLSRARRAVTDRVVAWGG